MTNYCDRCFLTKLKNYSKIISEFSSDEFLSGDNYNKISSVSIYEKSYYERYIKHNISKNIIFVNENNSNIVNLIKHKTNIFFTKIEYINYFIVSILPYLKEKFILITHNGDSCSGNNEVLLNNPLLLKWYGQNMNKLSVKTCGIPIGLENKIWNHTNFNTIKKCVGKPKTKLLYLNFSLHTNPERKDIMKNLLNKGFSKNQELPWDKYIDELSNYKFAISPHGNGYDCHRTWECLYLGVIPIVIDSIPTHFFKELPILYVKNFDVITPEFLQETYNNQFKDKIFNLESLHISFWKNKFIKQQSI
tara:strand:- start:2258 stop:3172 length:915 start_codon:yes stop_codon:yes gene_type:complete